VPWKSVLWSSLLGNSRFSLMCRFKDSYLYNIWKSLFLSKKKLVLLRRMLFLYRYHIKHFSIL
jgi:hypothetical protein